MKGIALYERFHHQFIILCEKPKKGSVKSINYSMIIINHCRYKSTKTFYIKIKDFY